MSDVISPSKDNFDSFCGYHQNWQGESMTELTQTGPGTPCGDYLRRYWHPVFITAELGDKPQLIRIETRAGHGSGKPTDKVIAEGADVLAFLAHFTDLQPVQKK